MQLQQAAQANVAPADVSMMSQVSTLKGMQVELWAPLDPAKIPEFRQPQAANSSTNIPTGASPAIGAVTWYITLVSNTDAYPERADSWAFLWDPANKADKLGLLALVSNSFLLEITAKTFFGGTEKLDTEREGILKVMDKIAELKPNVKLWYRDEAQFEQALKSGEIPMGQYYHDVTGLAAADGSSGALHLPEGGRRQRCRLLGGVARLRRRSTRRTSSSTTCASRRSRRCSRARSARRRR